MKTLIEKSIPAKLIFEVHFDTDLYNYSSDQILVDGETWTCNWTFPGDYTDIYIIYNGDGELTAELIPIADSGYTYRNFEIIKNNDIENRFDVKTTDPYYYTSGSENDIGTFVVKCSKTNNYSSASITINLLEWDNN